MQMISTGKTKKFVVKECSKKLKSITPKQECHSLIKMIIRNATVISQIRSGTVCMINIVVVGLIWKKLADLANTKEKKRHLMFLLLSPFMAEFVAGFVRSSV